MAEQDDNRTRTPAQVLNEIHENVTTWALNGLTAINDRMRDDVKRWESE